MSQTTISELPDLPLQNIFKRLSLTDQIHGVRRVCVGWRALLQTELDRRRSLVLLPDHDQNGLNAFRIDTLHCHDMLQYVRKNDGSPMVRLPTQEQFNYDFVPLRIAVRGSGMMSALPGITHLTVAYRHISPAFLRKINRMLHHWSDTLVSLTLYLENILHFKKCNDRTLLSMFEAIDQLQSLRHLQFNLTRDDARDMCICYDPYPKLEIVSRLSTLCVTSGINPEWFYHTLKHEASGNDNLREICYHHDICFGSSHDVFGHYSEYPPLKNRFTSIYTSDLRWSMWNESKNERMQRLCTRFAWLTTLTLDMEPSTLSGLAQHLSRLQHLITLKLKIGKCPEGDFWNDRPGFVDGWPILGENQAPQFQVLSVQLLDLTLTTASHENITALYIPDIFPNIQVVRLLQQSGNCYTCKYDSTDVSKNEMKTRISECMRLARQSFRRCAHLHTIVYNQDPCSFASQSMRLISPQDL